MTHPYIGTKEIVAWPAEKDGAAGYSVKYADGYTSWSPKGVFEDAYRVSEGDGQALTFGDALHFLKGGKRVARVGWNGKGMWLGVCDDWNGNAHPDSVNFALLPFIYMRTAQGDIVPWLASQTDMLDEDWQVLP